MPMPQIKQNFTACFTFCCSWEPVKGPTRLSAAKAKPSIPYETIIQSCNKMELAARMVLPTVADLAVKKEKVKIRQSVRRKISRLIEKKRLIGSSSNNFLCTYSLTQSLYLYHKSPTARMIPT